MIVEFFKKKAHSSIEEFKQLEEFIIQAFFALQEKREMEKAKLQEHEKFKSIAKQVAHDIRSPLTALDVMMGYVTQLPEKDRLVIRNSVQRINDIANNLLSRYSDTSDHITNDIAEIKTTELFITMLESILSEKKVQYANKSVEFTISFASEARSLFANVNLSVFNRVLSNIINNAVEAFDKNKKGSIKLVLSQNQKNILLWV